MRFSARAAVALPLAAWLAALPLAAPRAMPVAPGVICESYPEAPLCAGGQPPCATCHTTPPSWNRFGTDVGLMLLPDEPRPLDPALFAAALPAVLATLEGFDSDMDGVTNLEELLAGSNPGDDTSLIVSAECRESWDHAYDFCHYDHDFVLRKLSLDFCGRSPSFEELEAFAALDDAGKLAELHARLDDCLAAPFWRGRDGQVWQLAHTKLRPLGSINIPEFTYDDAYKLFAWAHLDDHDVRDVLTADYYVVYDDASGVYSQVAELPASQQVPKARRAGVLTTSWYLLYFVMFTGLPRTAAAQAYRAFLGTDIARLEGLRPVTGEPIDYDAKGVGSPVCAVCHATLDPLAYPFSRYFGLPAIYDPNRVQNPFFDSEGPLFDSTPESGVIFGQPVADLVEWAAVAADSDEYAAAVVRDYWRLLMGRDVRPEELVELVRLFRDLKGKHGWRVSAMLHDFIETEAYGVP